MHKLKSLTESYDTVWFYCRTERLAEEFLKQCEEEGFLTLNGQKPTLLFRHKFYGVFDDMTMGYLSNMIWCLTFQNEIDEHVRIDYEKYISEAEDYYCHKTAQMLSHQVNDLTKQVYPWDNIMNVYVILGGIDGTATGRR